VKPIPPSRQPHSRSPDSSAPGAGGQGQKSLLVIDDEPSIRHLLQVLLTDEGYHVRTAPDGPAGLRAVADSPPDCVLLDVMMPGMDGYEVLQELRCGPHGHNLTIVMLTAASDDRSAWAAWRGGVDYFLSKPFDVHVLLPYLNARFAPAMTVDRPHPERTPHATATPS
jgi:DNA-binding response OmpR family regulator